ncbi:hypothetical protein SLEP1_g51714 [Rubroshorea leprosula]|uniref:25S rRNA (uridine-N(3))-methyltransferase BMT5-like domain-containing protein n=1 Tax=Rubroshorea leprosula TaxID=152421 RepID=A0AAV5M6A3_9ROSI|nr:hypothetical protein SLEP1_g51714 [Rubroshorea leprosula]
MGQIFSIFLSIFRVREDRNDHCLPTSLESLLLDGGGDDNPCLDIVIHSNISTELQQDVEENKQDSIHTQDLDSIVEIQEKDGDGKREEDRWIQHYCSSQKMLLVGEGDFSFSASLAKAFGSASNMIATSLDSRVDATEMANHSSLEGIKFDRIVYNFPHAGFFANETSESQKSRHQMLISLFFKNAAQMIHGDGEVHVTHKSRGFFLDWNLKHLASTARLQLMEEVPFNFTDYEGYHTKYGFGGDKNFNCNPCKTYKFRLQPPESPTASSTTTTTVNAHHKMAFAI